jgi:hypothetical protein
MKTATEILTTTLPTGETVLAKSMITKDSDAIIPDGVQHLVPLRYGNETAAKKKLSSISHVLSTNNRAAEIVKQNGRFLIFLYPVSLSIPVSCDDVERIMVNSLLASMTPSIRRRFATVSGARQNPRNRHNHSHKLQTDQPYYFGE